MGLGLLFIGYVLVAVFTLAPTYFLTDLIGSFVIFEALGKLRRNAERFKYAVWSVYAMFSVSAVQCAYYAVKYIGLIEGYEIFENALEAVRLAVMYALTVTVLLALSQLASSVGDKKLADKGVRNVWLFSISYVFMIVLSLDFGFLTEFKSAFSAFGFAFRILAVLLNCVYLYSCYMWICLEGDHDMSRLSVLDRFFGKLAPKPKEKKPDGEEPEPPPIPGKKRKKLEREKREED